MTSKTDGQKQNVKSFNILKVGDWLKIKRNPTCRLVAVGYPMRRVHFIVCTVNWLTGWGVGWVGVLISVHFDLSLITPQESLSTPLLPSLSNLCMLIFSCGFWICWNCVFSLLFWFLFILFFGVMQDIKKIYDIAQHGVAWHPLIDKDSQVSFTVFNFLSNECGEPNFLCAWNIFGWNWSFNSKLIGKKLET